MKPQSIRDKADKWRRKIDILVDSLTVECADESELLSLARLITQKGDALNEKYERYKRVPRKFEDILASIRGKDDV